jgi:hypothetical protein
MNQDFEFAQVGAEDIEDEAEIDQMLSQLDVEELAQLSNILDAEDMNALA